MKTMYIHSQKRERNSAFHLFIEPYMNSRNTFSHLCRATGVRLRWVRRITDGPNVHGSKEAGTQPPQEREGDPRGPSIKCFETFSPEKRLVELLMHLFVFLDSI